MNASWEARVLRSPAAAFRELAQDPQGGRWVLVRRPLLLAFMFGCLLSFLASSRLSVRLIADGALSFAFVPLFELAAFAVVYRLAPRRIPFAGAADLFFAANAPWLLLMIGLAVVRCLQTPIQATAPPWIVLWIELASIVAVAAWSVYVDIQFFRHVLSRPPAGAGRDVMLQRAISWSAIAVYFFGLALWPEIVVRLGA